MSEDYEEADLSYTDLSKMIAVFDRCGIEYEIWRDVSDYDNDDDDGGIGFDSVITIDRGIGFAGFYTRFYFLHGKFVNHGVWE